MRYPLTCRVCAAILVAWLISLSQAAMARPEYLARYQADPLRRPEMDGCSACHVAQSGGGARNEFGSAFEAASLEITPLLRSSFPKHFKFDTVKLADGSVLSFADPQSKLVVVERKEQRFLAELAALTEIKAAPLPAAANRMSFFVTSRGPASFDRFGGLAGADRHCQALAKAASADDRTWRAYLSTSLGDKPAVNAGDRIGGGPWYNAKGTLVARGPADLHAKERLPPELLLTETGESAIAGPSGNGIAVVTGTLANGTAAVGRNCENWTSLAGDAAGSSSNIWNTGGTVSCSANDNGARLYCFAVK